MDANTMPPAGRATQDLNDAVFDMDCLVYSVSGHRKMFDFIWSQVGMDRLDPPALYEYERELLLFSWGELSGAVVKLEKAYDKVSEIERAGREEARP